MNPPMAHDLQSDHTRLQRALWWLVLACFAHVAEEFGLDWSSWVKGLSGLSVGWGLFAVANAAFLILAAAAASFGPARPVIAFALPSLTLINAVLFHLGPTLVQGRLSPGVFTSAALYLPLSVWIFREAARCRLLSASLALRSFALGAFVMALPLVLIRLL